MLMIIYMVTIGFIGIFVGMIIESMIDNIRIIELTRELEESNENHIEIYEIKAESQSPETDLFQPF